MLQPESTITPNTTEVRPHTTLSNVQISSQLRLGGAGFDWAGGCKVILFPSPEID